MAYANESRKAVDGKMSDLIRREDAVQMLDEYIKPFVGLVGDIGSGINGAREIIKSIPSADRPRGEWIVHSNDKIGECSKCGSGFDNTVIDVPNWRFCPNCGARMFVKDINGPNKKGADDDYERAVEQMEYDMLYEPTYNPEDGSM